MRQLLICVGLAVLTVNCGIRVPDARAVPPGMPHVSWIIMHGNSDNPDAEFACQSTGPRECVLPASAKERVFSDVHLYFHGVGPETTYRGSYRIEFSDNAAPFDTLVETVVRGDKNIANRSINGLVTSRPGPYALRLTFDAVSASGSTRIREEIPVLVR